MKRNRLAKNLLIIAKVWSVITLGFLLFMLSGHIFGDSEESFTVTGFKLVELIAFIFFPIGTSIGLMIGWRKNITGGLITIICLSVFFAMILIPRGVNLERGVWMFPLLNFPGFLYVFAGLLEREK